MAEIKSKSGQVLGAEVLQQLKSEIKGENVIKGEAAESVYREAIDRFNKAGVAEAGIVVFPQSEAEVAICLKFVQQHNIDLAVTCGRHNYFQASSTKGGLVIDLKKLKGVKIDTDNMRISAQGGCQAVDLEGPLTKLGMSVVMGAVNDTGIGGITLGGGTGPLTGQRGLIIDNLLAARVVVANGDILEASEEKNPDLFWAIRGGGGNFGVVTEFTYKIHKQEKIWWAILAFTPDKNKAFLELAEPIRQAVEVSGGKLWSFFNFAKLPGMPSVHPLSIVFYDGPESEGMKWAQPLFDLGPAVVPKNETIDLVELTTPKPEFLGPATHQL